MQHNTAEDVSALRQLYYMQHKNDMSYLGCVSSVKYESESCPEAIVVLVFVQAVTLCLTCLLCVLCGGSYYNKISI